MEENKSAKEKKGNLIKKHSKNVKKKTKNLSKTQGENINNMKSQQNENVQAQ